MFSTKEYPSITVLLRLDAEVEQVNISWTVDIHILRFTTFPVYYKLEEQFSCYKEVN